MVKLKLKRDKLRVLANCFSPAITEAFIAAAQRNLDYTELENLFLLLEIGESFTRKFYFQASDKYSIKLRYADACALLIGCVRLLQIDLDGHAVGVLLETKNALHQQIVSYQRRVYDARSEANAGELPAIDGELQLQLIQASKQLTIQR